MKKPKYFLPLRVFDLVVLFVLGFSFLISAIDVKMGLGYIIFISFGSLFLAVYNYFKLNGENKK